VNAYITGPYFYNETLTRIMYDNFIQKELPAILKNIDLVTKLVCVA